MTEQTAEQTDVAVEQVDQVDAEQTEQEVDQGQEQGKASREAAKYRTQLRAVETERDTLAAKVEAMQRAEVERLASSEVTKPAGMWAAGVKLADLLADDGTVDPAKVKAAAADAVANLGLESPRARLLRGNVVPREGSNPGGGRGGNGMADVIRG